MSNPFFKNTGPYNINFLLNNIGLKNQNINDHEIIDIKDLNSSHNNEITFFHSKKYSNLASKTKANFCITTENLKNYLPNSCKKIIVENVLIATAKITKLFYFWY